MHQYLLIVMSEMTIYWVFWWRFSFYGIPFLLTWLYNLSIVIPGVSCVSKVCIDNEYFIINKK